MLGESYCLCRYGITHSIAKKFGSNLGDCSGSHDFQIFQVGELPNWRKMHTGFAIYDVHKLHGR